MGDVIQFGRFLTIWGVNGEDKERLFTYPIASRDKAQRQLEHLIENYPDYYDNYYMEREQ